MKAAFLVELVEPHDLVHDFLNFGEDVYRVLRDDVR